MDLSSILPSGLFSTNSGEQAAPDDNSASIGAFSQIFGQTLQQSLSGSGTSQEESGHAVGLLGQSLALGVAQSLIPTQSTTEVDEASAETGGTSDSGDSSDVSASSETASSGDASSEVASETADSDTSGSSSTNDAISAAASAWSDECLSDLMVTQALEKNIGKNG